MRRRHWSHRRLVWGLLLAYAAALGLGALLLLVKFAAAGLPQ